MVSSACTSDSFMVFENVALAEQLMSRLLINVTVALFPGV